MGYYGTAAKQRQMGMRVCAILSMIGSFGVLVALFGYGALHDYAAGHQHYAAAVLALIVLGVSSMFLAIFAAIIAAEYR